MKCKYDMVVFDLDGTVLDTSEGIIAATIYTIKEHRLKMPTDAELLEFIGPPVRKKFMEYYGVDLEEGIRLGAHFRERYGSHELMKASVYDGMFDAMKVLKGAGVRMGVATYKGEENAKRLLLGKGFGEYLDAIHGADVTGNYTKPDMIRFCARDCGIDDIHRVAVVGDSCFDAAGAMELGCDFVAVTYGFGFRPGDPVEEPHIGVADTPEEILKYLF